MPRIPDLPLEKQTVKDVTAFLLRYRNDPALFASEVIGLDFDQVQRKIADLMLQNDRVAVASARGCAKSTTAALMAVHFMVTRPNALVGLTSNTAYQTSTVLWRYIRRLVAGSAIHDWLQVKEESITMSGRDELLATRIVWDPSRIEATSGLHSPHLLYILDEASLIPAALIQNLESSCTEKDNRMLLISNPTRPSGFFYDCFKDGSGWSTYQISGYESAFTNKDFLDSLVGKYGRDSDLCRVQVFGQFPRQASARMISPELLERWLRAAPTPGSGDAVLGIDVGAGGDETVWVVRHGARIRHISSQRTEDLATICAETVRIVSECGVRWICVDSTGVGAFVPGELRNRLPGSVWVESVNFGDASPEEDTYNMRAWIYRRLADLLRQHPEASFEGEREDLEAQVDATETFQDERSGKTRLVPKKLISASIGHSPDLLDAVALTCAIQGPLCRTSSLEDAEAEDAEMDSLIEQASKWL